VSSRVPCSSSPNTGEAATRRCSLSRRSNSVARGYRWRRTYPPPADWYKDNTGSFLLDVFVYENENKAAFQQFLQALIRQNPEDTAFVAQAQGFLK
jgi:hypothetical protein